MAEQSTRARAASLLEEKHLPTDKLRHLLLQLGTNLAGPATPEQLVRIIVQSSRPERVCEYVERLSSEETPQEKPRKTGGPTFHVGKESSEVESKSETETHKKATQPSKRHEVVEPPKRKEEVEAEIPATPKRQEVAPPPPKPRPEPVAREVSEPQYVMVPVSLEPSQPQESSETRPEQTPEAPKRHLGDALLESPIQIKSFPKNANYEYEAFTPVADTAASLVTAATVENPELGIAETPVAVSHPETPFGEAVPDSTLPLGAATSDGFNLGESAEPLGPAMSQEQRKSEVYTEEDRMRRISAGSQASLTGVDMPIHLSEEERARRASDGERTQLATQPEEVTQEEESEENKEEARARSKLVMAQADLEKVQRMQSRAEEAVANDRESRASRRASIDLAIQMAEEERLRRINEEAAKVPEVGEQVEEQRVRAERRRSVDLAVELAEAERQRRIAEESSQPRTSEGGEETDRPRPTPSGRKSGIAHLISQWSNNDAPTPTADSDNKPRKSSTTAPPPPSASTPRTPIKRPPPPPRS